jgi:hypothetical protein
MHSYEKWNTNFSSVMKMLRCSSALEFFHSHKNMCQELELNYIAYEFIILEIKNSRRWVVAHLYTKLSTLVSYAACPSLCNFKPDILPAGHTWPHSSASSETSKLDKQYQLWAICLVITTVPLAERTNSSVQRKATAMTKGPRLRAYINGMQITVDVCCAYQQLLYN